MKSELKTSSRLVVLVYHIFNKFCKVDYFCFILFFEKIIIVLMRSLKWPNKFE